MTDVVLPDNAALLLIDLQRGIDDASWGRRNNPELEANIARLLAAWRKTARMLFHVRHDSTEPQSTYRPGQPGNDFKPEAQPRRGEMVIAKQTNSAFVGTDLDPLLRGAGIDTLVIGGVITNNSVEATVRMAGNLGYTVYLLADGCETVDKKDLNGRLWPAEDVHALSLANMDGEYATVVATAEILQALPTTA